MSDCTIVTSDHHGNIRTTLYQTIVFPGKLATGSIHDYIFCYCPLVCILFEVLRIGAVSDFITSTIHPEIYQINVAGVCGVGMVSKLSGSILFYIVIC